MPASGTRTKPISRARRWSWWAPRRADLASGLATTILLAAWPTVAGADPFAKGPYLQDVTRTEVAVMWQSDPACAGTIHVGAATIDAPSAQM